MRKARFVSGLAVVMLVVGLVFVPASGHSQCNYAMTSLQNPLPSINVVYKFFTGAETCSNTVYSALGCFPVAPTPVTHVIATALTTSVTPVCQFNCGCGTVTVDGSDGLPVELMEFSVE